MTIATGVVRVAVLVASAVETLEQAKGATVVIVTMPILSLIRKIYLYLHCLAMTDGRTD